MPYSNYTESLLDLKDVIVTNIKAEENVRTIYLEQKRTPHICPSCGTQTDHVHDYRVQSVKYLPVLGKHTVLLFRKRRYSCPCCGCSLTTAIRMFDKFLFLSQVYPR